MHTLSATLGRLAIGAPQAFRNLSMFPLAGPVNGDANYLTLDEAFEASLSRVTEISEGGHVPELAFDNRADKPVLLVDGEELVGARQNRILNITILVGAGKQIVIPVSCVEAGRWAYRTREFRSQQRSLYAGLRAKKMEQVSQSMASTGNRRSNQSAIWDDIAFKQNRMHTASATGSMSDIYEGHHAHLADYQQAFKWTKGQAGAVFAVAGNVMGLELFDSDKTFGKFLAKLVSSYTLDAIEVEANESAAPSLDDVRALIERIKNAKAECYPALGEGEDVRMSGEKLAGGALFVGERVVHLSAFHCGVNCLTPL